MKTEFKIGLIVAAAITFFILGFNFLRGRGAFSNEVLYYVYYNDVTGLQKSAPVTCQGVQVGKVLDMAFDKDGKIKVTIGIKNSKLLLPIGTEAQLITDNLLSGSKTIKLELGKNTQTIKAESVIPAVEAQGLLNNISTETGPLMSSLRHTISTVDTLVNSVNTIVNTQAQAQLASSFKSLDITLKNFASLSESLNKQTANLTALMANLKSITENIANNNNQITAILNNAQRATGNIADAKIKESFDNIASTMSAIQTTLHQITDANGSLGLIIKDRKLYDNLNATLSSLDSIITDIKKRPSRYINVSVFGRKNKD